MYDLILKGGKVIDPAQGIQEYRDVAISEGKIVVLKQQLLPSEAKRVIAVQGKIITPGLIDLHAHVADGIIPVGLAPDEAGVTRGVTTVCDGGSTGCANFTGFKRYVIARSRTDVFCFLHICPTGLAVMPEIRGWDDVDTEATLRIILENLDIVKGIKLRAIGPMAENLGLDAVKVAKRLSKEAGVPLMVHLGDMRERTPRDIMDTFTSGLLPLLDQGDIVTHIFTWAAGGVINPEGSVLPELLEAKGRGVVLDAAHGLYNFSFETAKHGIAKGILPTTISTDLSPLTAEEIVISLPVTMSKFLALGLSLYQVIEMTTINPAQALGEEHRRGALKPGMPADISVLKMDEGDFTFSDGKGGHTLKGKLLLIPELVLKAGVPMRPGGKPAPRRVKNA